LEDRPGHPNKEQKMPATEQPFAGQAAIVTGASRGIGATLAAELARLGAKVACVARGAGRSHITDRGSIEQTVAAIIAAGGEAIGIEADIAVESEIIAMVDQAAAHFGRLDILVNNAGVVMNATDLLSDLTAIDHEMAVNLRGPLVAMRACVPHMRKTGQGRFLNVSSNVALNVFPSMMTYGVSKLALERLSLDVAAQLRDDNIACNVFRIDVPVTNSISEDHEMFTPMRPYFEPAITAAEGMIWMLRQPPDYTGQLDSILRLRDRENIMPQRAEKAFTTALLPGDPASVRLNW
jgi:NAD(P)-dependent dehydrogenase (short-subunit alcohol dehydrogenase family)